MAEIKLLFRKGSNRASVCSSLPPRLTCCIASSLVYIKSFLHSVPLNTFELESRYKIREKLDTHRPTWPSMMNAILRFAKRVL